MVGRLNKWQATLVFGLNHIHMNPFLKRETYAQTQLYKYYTIFSFYSFFLVWFGSVHGRAKYPLQIKQRPSKVQSASGASILLKVSLHTSMFFKEQLQCDDLRGNKDEAKQRGTYLFIITEQCRQITSFCSDFCTIMPNPCVAQAQSPIFNQRGQSLNVNSPWVA